jgi:GNAT superfamily N-acetyltransferase
MILEADINTMFAIAVLEEKVEGKVYTDDEANPASVYISHSYGMSLLYGESSRNEFYKELVSYILNSENVRDKFEWLQVYPSSLYSVMDKILGENLIKMKLDDVNGLTIEEKKVFEYQRINLIFKKDNYMSMKKDLAIQAKNKNDQHNDKNKIIPTSEAVFNQLKEGVVPKYFWNNYNDFIKNGKGYTILSEDNIHLCTAFASFTSDNKLEIGIETNKEYRGLGFATRVCIALIDYCLEKGYEPVWSCNSANLGSQRLAHKLGFEELKRIPYYRLPK